MKYLLICLTLVWTTSQRAFTQNGFIDQVIDNDIQTSGVHQHNGCNCIFAPGNPNTPVQYSSQAQVTYTAGQCIHLQDGFSAQNFSNNGFFHAHILPKDFELAIIEPTNTNGTVGQHEKLEIGIDLPQGILDDIEYYLENNTTQRYYIDHDFSNSNCQNCEAINPFDSEDLKVEATFTSLSNNQTIVREGFFFQNYERRNLRIPGAGNNPSLTTESYPSFYPCQPTFILEDNLSFKQTCLDLATTNENDSWVREPVLLNTPGGKEFNFRIRFAPPTLGEWEVSIAVVVDYDNKPDVSLNSDCIHFEVLPSSSKGYVEVTPNKRYLQFSETQDFFFPVGENIFSGTPYGMYGNMCSNLELETFMDDFLTGINDISTGGGNFTRIGMDAVDFDIEWEDLGNYVNRMGTAQELDLIIDSLETLDMYAILVMTSHHNFQKTWRLTNADYSGIPNDPIKYPRAGGNGAQNHWNCSPYTQMVETPMEYFSVKDPFQPGYSNDPYNPNLLDNPTWDYMKRKLRYIVARWGYSTHIAAWEILDELDQCLTNFYPVDSTSFFDADDATFSNDGTDEQENNQRNLYEWYTEMSRFIKQDLNDPHLITTSIAGLNLLKPNNDDLHYDFWGIPDLDITQLHVYGRREDENSNVRFLEVHDFTKGPYSPDKPILFGEIGPRPALLGAENDVTFHNNLWSSALMGCLGPGLSWFWRTNNAIGAHLGFQQLRNFMAGEDLRTDIYTQDIRFADGDRLENFKLTKNDKSKILGWIHNRSYWIQNYPKSFPGQFPLLEAKFADITPDTCDLNTSETASKNCKSIFNPHGHYHEYLGQTIPYPFPSNYPTVDPCKCGDAQSGTMNWDSQFDVVHDVLGPVNVFFKGLNTGSEYQLEIFQTEGNNPSPVSSTIYCSGSLGYIIAAFPSFDFSHPDWAYKLTEIGTCPSPPSFRKTSEEAAISLKVHPNPGDGLFTLNLTGTFEAAYTVSVYDHYGKLVFEQGDLHETTHHLDLSYLAKGIYELRILLPTKHLNAKMIIQ